MFALCGREFVDFCDVGELFGRPAAAEGDGYLDLFLRVAWSDFARAGRQCALAAGQVYAFFNLWHEFLLSISDVERLEDRCRGNRICGFGSGRREAHNEYKLVGDCCATA